MGGGGGGVQDQGPWEQLEAAGAGTQGNEGDSRPVRMGPGALNRSFCGNAIHTAKYNVITFLPLFLFTMFSRVAYLYFLAQVGLMPLLLYILAQLGLMRASCCVCCTFSPRWDSCGTPAVLVVR